MSVVSRPDYHTTAYYASLEEATKAEKAFALRKGYCLKILRTQTRGNKKGGLIKRRTLACVHGGKANSQAQVRVTSTLRQGCPFQLRICRENEDGDNWSSKITNLEHNHEPADNVAAYPSARTLTESEIETVHELSSIGIKPRNILRALRERNTSNLSTTRDIQNILKFKKRKTLDLGNLFSQIQQEHDLLLPHQQQLFMSSIKEILDRSRQEWNSVMAPTRGTLTEPTGHNSSSTELAEQTQLLPRHSCSNCNLIGHNSRTCPQRNTDGSS